MPAKPHVGSATRRAHTVYALLLPIQHPNDASTRAGFAVSEYCFWICRRQQKAQQRCSVSCFGPRPISRLGGLQTLGFRYSASSVLDTINMLVRAPCPPHPRPLRELGLSWHNMFMMQCPAALLSNRPLSSNLDAIRNRK